MLTILTRCPVAKVTEDFSTKLPTKKKSVKRGQMQNEREERGNSESNTICIGGEEGVIVKNDIFLRILDTVGSLRPLDIHTWDNDEAFCWA